MIRVVCKCLADISVKNEEIFTHPTERPFFFKSNFLIWPQFSLSCFLSHSAAKKSATAMSERIVMEFNLQVWTQAQTHCPTQLQRRGENKFISRYISYQCSQTLWKQISASAQFVSAVILSVESAAETVNRNWDLSLTVHFLYQCHMGFTMAPPLWETRNSLESIHSYGRN